jgi:phage shock protein E
MKSSLKELGKELGGGVALMIVAALVGVTVNAVRPNGVALIQAGAPVTTAQHGDVDTTATDVAPAEGIVTLGQMKELHDAGMAIIIDARSPTEYEEGHIPGAINIPHDRIPEFMEVLNNEVSMEAQVVVYCRSVTCDFSDLLATEMKVIGYQNVSVFSGGWDHWTKAGYPVEKGPRS